MLYALCHLLYLDLHPYMLICLDLHALCFVPSFMFRSTSLHAYMFRSTCFILFAMLSMLRSIIPMCFYVCSICLSYMFYALCHVFLCLCASFCSMLMLGLHAHILDIMSTVMPCLDLHFLFPCLYVLYGLCHLPCACALHAMFVSLGLDLFVMPCAIIALLSLCLSFLCFALMVRTRSRPYGLCHHPYTSANINGFGSPYLHVYVCLLLCFILVLASFVLGFSMLDTRSGFAVVWLHSMPMRPYWV